MLKKGIGFACAFQGTNYHFGHPDVSKVMIEVSDQDQLLIHAAASDNGQGLEATMITIVSQAFGGLPAERVRWTGSSTREPDAGVTGASRQTTMTGNAVLEASLHLKEILRSVAAEMLEAPPETIVFQGETVTAGAQKQATLAEVLDQARKEGRSLKAAGHFEAPLTTKVDEHGRGDPINQFGYATCLAEVQVDTDTGEVEVLRIASYHDSGRIVHLVGAEGQVEGGVVMGLGYALTEDYMTDGGKPVNVGFTDYLIPTVHDSAAPCIEAHFVDNPVPMGKLGAKGLAEVPSTVVAPAILNAIHNATGARVTQLPATPERVYEAIREAQKERNGPNDR